MKILVYQWASYNYRDVIEGFRAMGHEVCFLPGKPSSYDEDASFFEETRKELRRIEAAFLFSINYFGVLSDACEAEGVPYVCWTCDSALLSMHHKSIRNSVNRLFFFDRGDMERIRLQGPVFVRHLPLCADPKRTAALLGTGCGGWLSEIAFVGSLYEKNTYDELEPKMDDYLRGYLDAAIEAQLSVSGGNLFDRLLTPDILARIGERFDLRKSRGSDADLSLIFSSTVLGFKAASEMRIRCLSALSARHDLILYSNSVPADSGIRRKPSADYWTKAPEIYAKTKINLNFTIPNILTGLPLRIYDVLSAGGFLLTDYRSELTEEFQVGEELECFESVEELEAKCAYYLSHEEERKRIAENGRKRVCREHTIEKRLEKLLAELA